MKQLLVLVITICVFFKGEAQTDTPVLPKPKTVIGIASFYSSNLDGTKTATGEIFRNSKMTCASNNFKLNTWVRVTNLRNNKVIKVRINDRMHEKMAHKGRVVDLSRAAVKELGFIGRGLTRVKVEEIVNPHND
jgi:rare lipoprotein A